MRRVILFACFLGACSPQRSYDLDFASYKKPIHVSTSATLIAHAGGATPDGRYSNSVEALDDSYRAGLRWFEVDLALTTDRQVVLLHDWRFAWRYWFGGRKPVSLKEFEATKMRGARTPTSFLRFCRWLKPDAQVFLHIRDPNVIGEAAKVCPDRRLVAFVDTFELAADARKAGFRRVAVNAESAGLTVPEIVKRGREADYIVMWNETYTRSGIATAAKAARIVVPTVNDPKEAVALGKVGVAGIMSDVLRT